MQTAPSGSRLPAPEFCILYSDSCILLHMSAPIQLVQGLYSGGASLGGIAPLFLLGGSLLSWGHRSLWLIRKGELYAHQDNWLMLACGFGLERVAGDYAVVQMGAQILALTVRIDEAIKRWQSLSANGDKLYNHFCTAPVPRQVAWRGFEQWHALSPSHYIRMCEKGSDLHCWCNQTASLLISIAIDAFGLLMCLKEAFDTVSWDPSVRRDNVRELFLNAFNAVDTISNEGEALVAALRLQEDKVEEALTFLEAPFGSKELIEKVTQLVAGAKKVHDVVQPLRQQFGDETIDTFKKGVCGAMASLGLLDILPDAFFEAMIDEDITWRSVSGCLDERQTTKPSKVLKDSPIPLKTKNKAQCRASKIASFKKAMESVKVGEKW